MVIKTIAKMAIIEAFKKISIFVYPHKSACIN